MAIYSMTGFASAAVEGTGAGSGSGGGLVVELRSVNGRFLDLSLRLPDELRALEPALREVVTGAVKRGKVELRVADAGAARDTLPNPGTEQLSRLATLQTTVQAWLPQAAPLSVHEALGWCRGGSSAPPQAEAVLALAQQAAAALAGARAREGERLAAMLRDRLHTLRTLTTQAEPLVPQVVQRQQARFVEKFEEALRQAPGGATVPEASRHERALAEAAAYAIRLDVAEELSRLRAHLDEIERLLTRGGEVGKRLEFLIQELQREANTLGSKSAALELTAIAVEMKVAIEQMREQVQNIE